MTAYEIELIEAEVSNQDPGFVKFSEFPSRIVTARLALSVRPQPIIRYTGQPCCYTKVSSGALQIRRQTLAQHFFGVEQVICYAISGIAASNRGALVQERVTTLYDSSSRFDPNELNTFESTPFEINGDGTFLDIQRLGQYRNPLPASTIQLLRQELIIAGAPVVTIYIVRTPNEIVLLGYSQAKEIDK